VTSASAAVAAVDAAVFDTVVLQPCTLLLRMLLQGAVDLARCLAACEHLVMLVGDEQPQER
jgi:hypothetical protein